MTSTVRVSDFRARGSGGKKNHDGKPRDGTRLRAAYDALRRGEVVVFDYGLSKAQLELFYGMEFCPDRNRDGRKGYRLTGEWEGPYFVPIERIASEEDMVGGKHE